MIRKIYADLLRWKSDSQYKPLIIPGVRQRDSGVKRLILLIFFRAEAERRKNEENVPSIIYAIEEPETSQHTENHKKLIFAFLSLAETANTQVVITTHSAVLVKELKIKHLRLITTDTSTTTKTVQSVLLNQLPYQSLNEVNYLAFTEITEEYHNELYSFIEMEGLLNEYKSGKKNMQYTRIKNGTQGTSQTILSEYIRHQIHHPENTQNERYTFDQLKQSIEDMRSFIQSEKSK